MERLTIDMEGARTGELSAASLQLGDDTIAVQRIATMSVEAHQFLAYDTPGNQRTKGLYATFFVLCLFGALLALSFGGLVASGNAMLIAFGVGGMLALVSMFLGFKTLHYARYLKKQVPYYRLLIGTSDTRQIPLVDDNRDVLIKIRDVVRHKMDTGDTNLTGTFDLNLDIVDLNRDAPNAKVEDLGGDIAPVAEAGDEIAPAILFEETGLKDAS